jgi:hypothetical protein
MAKLQKYVSKKKMENQQYKASGVIKAPHYVMRTAKRY